MPGTAVCGQVRQENKLPRPPAKGGGTCSVSRAAAGTGQVKQWLFCVGAPRLLTIFPPEAPSDLRVQASDSRGPFTGTPHGPTFRVAGPQPGIQLALCWAGANSRLLGCKRPGGCAFKDEEQKTDSKLGMLRENRPQVELVLRVPFTLESCERNSGTC